MSKYYSQYNFLAGAPYKVEAGKDGVTEEDMQKLRRVNRWSDKINDKIDGGDEIEIISIDADVVDIDSNINLIDENADVEIIVEMDDEHERVRRAIKKLLPQQQELVNAIFYNGISVADFARKAGVTEGAIRDRLEKIYSRLKTLM